MGGGGGLLLSLPEREREGGLAIVMQMSLPCLLFVAGNLISSCVATIQTGGMLRMLLMTHTYRQKSQTEKHFISQRVSTCCHREKGQSVATLFFFLVYDKICFFVS